MAVTSLCRCATEIASTLMPMVVITIGYVNVVCRGVRTVGDVA
jgi:hypothetical protein